MSKETMMALVMNLLLLFFSAALVRSGQNTVPLRSFTISGNVTYDCINIYEQPGLDHYLLRNHTIQMKPSVSRFETKNQTSNQKNYRTKVECPDGTVPILKNKNEFITQHLAEKYFHPLTGDSPGTHIAGIRSNTGPYRGVEGWFNAYILNIEQDQASYNQIYIGSGMNNEVNYLSAGLMINPGLFGDKRVWAYGFWKGKDGKGCYNTACNGFVQVSQKIPIVGPIDLDKPGKPAWLHCSIHEDKQSGNWWITHLTPYENIGYWPKELFNLFDGGAQMAGAGGVVQGSRSGPSPPMGDGLFPIKGIIELENSAIFTNVEVLDSNYEKQKINSFPIEKLLDSTQCYGLLIGKRVPGFTTKLGYFFNYGGPGGNNCGI